MIVNVWFNVSALALLLVNLYVLLIRKEPGLRQNTWFRVVFTLVLIATVSELFSAILENMAIRGVDSVYLSKPVLVLCNTTYYGVHLGSCAAFVCYIYSTFGLRVNRPTQQLILILPILICFLLLMVNVLNGSVFYYDGKLTYHRGPLALVFYFSAAYYLVFIIILIISFRKNAKSDKLFSVVSFVALAVVANIVQAFLPLFRVECFANSLAVLLAYLTVESPTDYIDLESGLQNSTSFYIAAEAAVQRKMPREVIILTIDNVEALERDLGPSVVHDLLLSAAHYLEHLTRELGLYRIRSNTFAVVFPSSDSYAVENVCSELDRRFEQPFIVKDYNILLSHCYCVVSYPRDFKTELELKILVDLVSGEHSHVGQLPLNRRRIAVKDLDVEGEHRYLLLDKQLKTALEDGALDILYQPVYSVDRNMCDSFEVNMEITSKELGTVHERDFIPVAEKNGSMQRIFFYMLHRVCAFIKESRLLEKGTRQMEVVLPVSELVRKNIAEIISDVVDIYYIPHQMIAFELLEETIIAYEPRIAQNLQMLRERGFMLVMNNFGNGYTNASMMIKMPLSAVNLDNSLTHAAFTSKKADTLLLSTMEMLKRLRLQIKAKHIETVEQKEYAEQIGCTMMQGFYFSHALKGPEVDLFIADEKIIKQAGEGGGGVL